MPSEVGEKRTFPKANVSLVKRRVDLQIKTSKIAATGTDNETDQLLTQSPTPCDQEKTVTLCPNLQLSAQSSINVQQKDLMTKPKQPLQKGKAPSLRDRLKMIAQKSSTVVDLSYAAADVVKDPPGIASLECQEEFNSNQVEQERLDLVASESDFEDSQQNNAGILFNRVLSTAPNAFVSTVNGLKVAPLVPRPSPFKKPGGAAPNPNEVYESIARESYSVQNCVDTPCSDSLNLNLLRCESVLRPTESSRDLRRLSVPSLRVNVSNDPAYEHERWIRRQDERANLRTSLIENVCGQVSISAIRLKSERSRLEFSHFTNTESILLMAPENRAHLLDQLQRKCERLNFRRETYYLCQSYFDGYLDKVNLSIDRYQLLGITCMHIAMKMEEVDLVSLRDILNPNRNQPPLYSNSHVEQMEREVVSVLKFKLVNDTLYFWFDLAVQLWDLYLQVDLPHVGYQIFKPKPQFVELNQYEPTTNEFQLGRPNPYRVAVQALDLMSLHFQIHEYERPRLILAVLALMFMREVNLISFQPFQLPLQLQQEIRVWSTSQEDGPDQIFISFKHFLELYGKEFVPENFDFSNWAKELCPEMCFACQFFTLPTQFEEPECRKKRVVVSHEEQGEVKYKYAWIEEWLSLEHYSTAHQCTHQSWQSGLNRSYQNFPFVINLLQNGLYVQRNLALR